MCSNENIGYSSGDIDKKKFNSLVKYLCFNSNLKTNELSNISSENITLISVLL